MKIQDLKRKQDIGLAERGNMKINEILNPRLKEDASAGATASGNIAAVNMPLFTARRGKAHHKAARQAVDPRGHIFKREALTKAPYKMGYSADTLAYTKKVKDIYPTK